MAQSTIRFAASAGVLAASLLVLGPSPAQAVADKGGSGSHSGHGDQGDRWAGPGNRKRDADDWGNDILGIGDTDGDSQPATDGPGQGGLMDPGAGAPGDSGDLPIVATFDAGEANGPALRSAQAVAPPEGVNATGAVPRRSSGSDFVRPPTVSIRSPRVRVGNGRSPGLQANGQAPVREAPVVQEAPAPEPVAVEVDVPPPPLPPVEHLRPALPVVEEMARAEVDPGTDPLFGLAGLVLIPLVGAALGYRQARAAQAMGESARP